MAVNVRVSPISKTASILIIVIGALTLLAGVVTSEAAEMVAGVAFLVLGVVLYVILLRFTSKVQRDVMKAVG